MLMYCPKCGNQVQDNFQYCHHCGNKIGFTQSPTMNPLPVQNQNMVYQTSPKYKALGILFIILPFVTLIITLLIWAVVIFVVGQTDESNPIINIIQWLLGLVGLLAVMGIFVLVPLGIYFLTRKSPITSQGFDERSGKGNFSEVPPEINGWNWGAGMLTVFWGIYYNVWISLLCFVPIVNIFWWIVMGIKGNEWAWRHNKWQSVEKFKESQRKWMPWGIVILVFDLMIIVTNILFFILSYSSSSY